MSKPFLISVLVLFACASTTVFGQRGSVVFNKYMDRQVNFKPVNFVTEDRFLVVNPLSDSLNIQIDTVTDLEKIIRKQLLHRVYAVEITNTQKRDLNAILTILTQFKNLTFLKLSDPLFPNPKDRPYQLPENIKDLQQLKAVEFSFTDKLDMDDALDKLQALNQLDALAITAFNHPVLTGVGKLSGVKHLKVSATNLDGVDLSNFKWETLHLSGSLPNTGHDAEVLLKLPGIKTLTSLNLRYYPLGNAGTLSQLKNLSALSLELCTVSPSVSLFSKLSALKSLTNLSVILDRDSVQTIKGIAQLSSLQYLRLAVPSLEKQPEQLNAVRSLKNLRSLSLNANKLKQLPDIFAGLTQLKYIRLDDNQLEQLPTGIFTLPNLEYLNASSNKLRQLPALERYKCRSIKKLDISYNALTTLPKAITYLTNLQILDAGANQLKAVYGEWQGMVQLKEVSFQNNMLTTFPARLQLLSSLEKIDISNNEISVIPDVTMVKEYNLRWLNLSNNQLTELPEHIGRYSKLETLQAEGNRLASVPESLGDCKNIKLLDFNSVSRRVYYDAEKVNHARFTFATANDDKSNNIKNLPAGLTEAKELTSLNLEGNQAINSAGVFNILLSNPRKNLRVNLKSTNITELPNDPRWADLTFFQLNLSNNKLETLPVAFANVNTIYEIILAGNPLKVDGAVFNGTISSKADLKILYDELHIDVPANVISNSEYAAALARHIRNFYYAERWEKGVEYAKKAMIADPAAYADNVGWDYIGTCRFKVNDYTGAIKDFEQYLIKSERNFIRVINFIDPVIRDKAKAHLALGQIVEAAKTYEYYYTNYGRGLAQTAVLYKAAGNNALFKSMLDMALRDALNALETNKRARPDITDDTVLDYAELLIIANKPVDAIEALGNYTPAAKPRQTTKAYLLATAKYLKDNMQFDSVKKSLSETVSASGKIVNWDFDLFNNWLEYSGLSKSQQTQLMELQETAK